MERSVKMTHLVYICYSNKDKPVADAVVAGLENKGICCWIAPRDITQNSPWGQAIVQAIEASRAMVIIFSVNSNSSNQVVRELERAVANNVNLIPFRIENINPTGAMSYFLSNVHWIDAFTPPLDKSLDRLAETIRSYLNIESQAMDEPIATDRNIADSNPSENENVRSRKRLREFLERDLQDNLPKDSYYHKADDYKQEGQLSVIDSLEVYGTSSQGLIQFCVGDLTRTSPIDAFDVLVVSAFRDDYFPMPGSLIGALDQKGISIESLAEDKEVDLRQAFSCWISREIPNPPPGIQFKRILCYEPAESAKVGELVGDIFRSLAPFLGGHFPVRSVATPLVASGSSLRVASNEILQQLVETAVHWMSSGLPLNCLKIVCLPSKNIEELSRLFSELKSRYSNLSLQKQINFSYDFFISYSHRDTREVELFLQTLSVHQKDLRIFIDRKNLNTGAAWQREIFESIDDSQKVAVFYSPSYLDSKVCIEEFNIALCRHRESDEPVLMPIYLYSAKLPTYMRLVQYFDCREFDQNKFNEAALELIKNIHK
jgi:hypothetical protein